MSSQQQDLKGRVPPREHLASTSTSRQGGTLGTNHDNEWYCKECHNRITVSPDGNREYGHARHRDASSGSERCPHWIGSQRAADIEPEEDDAVTGGEANAE